MSKMEMKHLINHDEAQPEGGGSVQSTYGSLRVSAKRAVRELSILDVIVFTVIFWNIYLGRKMLYPFCLEFAMFYKVPITSFSFVLSAFDVGGSLSVLLTLFPSTHRIRIRLLIFLLVIALAALYLIASFCFELSLIFVVRMGMGFISNTVSSEIRGILSVFSKDGESPNPKTPTAEQPKAAAAENKLALRILLAETSWFTSSAGWVVIGVILHRFDVDYVWYFGAICALFTSLSCYVLPRFSVSDVLAAKSSSNLLGMDGDGDDGDDDDDEERARETVWTQSHLHWFFVGQFLYIFGYCAFVATFGVFMQNAYGLNAQQLGFQTVFVAVAEATALVVASFTAKYRTNLWRAIASAVVTVAAATVFAIALWVEQTVPIVAVWVMVFVYTLWMEHAHLNCIVCVLEMTPRGLESKSALLGQASTSMASIAGLILGPHIIIWYGFSTMMKVLVVVQFAAIILWAVSRNIFNAKQQIKNLSTH